MFKDIEALMIDMLSKFKEHIPIYIGYMNTEKGDNILSGWPVDNNAFYLDALDDFPPYKISFLLFNASDPIVKSLNPSFDAIETYTLGITVIIADDMEADNNFYTVKKRYNRIIKQIITKEFVKRYISHKVIYKNSKEEVITSPNGVMYQMSAVYFDVDVTIS